MATGENPYLTGALAPVDDEVDLEDLTVTGQIPEALDGLFLRNGPNPQFPPRGDYHLFDGDGMLHGLWLRDGKARRYRNRYVRTAGFEAERRVGKSCFGGMVDVGGAEQEVRDEVGHVKNVANTHVIRHADRIMALWEVGLPHEITPELDTVGPFDFDGQLNGTMTAHPHEDPETGELLFFGYGLVPPYLTFYRLDAQGVLVEKAEIDLPDSVMMHDFAVTQNHVIFLDAPAIFDLHAALEGGEMFNWRPERGTRLGVFDRATGPSSMRWYDTEPGYVFHFLNAYELDGRIILDGCRQARLEMGLDERGRGDLVLPNLTRWTIDPSTGVAKQEQLDDDHADFPRIDERRTGLPNDIGYLTGWSTFPEHGGGTFDMVSRIEMATGAKSSYVHGPGRTTGETIFAADPDGTAEDDGWLLSYVHDAATDKSDVVVLDAHDPSAGPVATIHLPRRAPFGFHGSWLAN
ncbi:carotenoid oxygenase family protein [Actinospongicola halichondriae]|uniref:carotenoid oxygenase family protein n=1 Tax=Actinospongicola halichondriae TaxID=3236844 RepID=UPI003D39C214